MSIRRQATPVPPIIRPAFVLCAISRRDRMKIGLQTYAEALRRAVDDYYEQRLSFAAYRAERSTILDNIEEEWLRKSEYARREGDSQKF